MAMTEQDESFTLRSGGAGSGGGSNGSQRRAGLSPHPQGALQSLVPARSPAASDDDDPLVLSSGARAADQLKEDETIKGHGLRGWLRTFQIARVLGMLSFYLYLDGYDVRSNFYRRMSERRRAEAASRGRLASFQQWSREVDRRTFDRLVRII